MRARVGLTAPCAGASPRALQMWGLWVVFASVMAAAVLLALSMFLLRKRAASRRSLLGEASMRQHSKVEAATALPADLEAAACKCDGACIGEPCSREQLLARLQAEAAQLQATLAALRQ